MLLKNKILSFNKYKNTKQIIFDALYNRAYDKNGQHWHFYSFNDKRLLNFQVIHGKIGIGTTFESQTKNEYLMFPIDTRDDFIIIELTFSPAKNINRIYKKLIIHNKKGWIEYGDYLDWHIIEPIF